MEESKLTWPPAWDLFTAGQEYWRDAWERSVLTLDVLRQRGNNYVKRTEQTAPHVLTFPPKLCWMDASWGGRSTMLW